MKLIVGLGNLGRKYENNRHNAGFMVIDQLSLDRGHGTFKGELESLLLTAKFELSNDKSQMILAKPQTFMNNSGPAVKRILQRYGVSHEDLLVVHDDLDIKIGQFKLQFGKGPHLHNGIISIEETLGTKNFWRLRMGIENRIDTFEPELRSRKPERSRAVQKSQPKAGPPRAERVVGERYVLSNFSGPERAVLDKMVEETIVPVIKDWLLKRPVI